MLKAIEFSIDYRDGVFHTQKKASIFFSSVKAEDTANRIREAIEAIIKELPKAMKKDYHVTIDMNAIGGDYKFVDGFRYNTDNYDRKLVYRKYIHAERIFDVDREVVYQKKHNKYGYMVFDTAKLCKALQQDMMDNAHNLVWNHGRVAYDLSF